jgi:hypothetical protein
MIFPGGNAVRWASFSGVSAGIARKPAPASICSAVRVFRAEVAAQPVRASASDVRTNARLIAVVSTIAACYRSGSASSIDAGMWNSTTR